MKFDVTPLDACRRLSSYGFVYDMSSLAWRRQRDDAAVADEALQDLLKTWPQFADQALRILATHPEFALTCETDPHTMAMMVKIAPVRR